MIVGRKAISFLGERARKTVVDTRDISCTKWNTHTHTHVNIYCSFFFLLSFSSRVYPFPGPFCRCHNHFRRCPSIEHGPTVIFPRKFFFSTVSRIFVAISRFIWHLKVCGRRKQLDKSTWYRSVGLSKTIQLRVCFLSIRSSLRKKSKDLL